MKCIVRIAAIIFFSFQLLNNFVNAFPVGGGTFGGELHKIIPSDISDFDQFGYSVATDAGLAIVGALQAEGDGSSDIGSAYIFDAITGAQLAEISAGDGVPDNRFGTSVAIDNSWAIVGAPRTRKGSDFVGAAYVFNATTGEQTQKLVPLDGAQGDEFGMSVAIYGNLALVGARKNDSPRPDGGSAYLFDIATGQQLFKLSANDAAVGDQFGQSVALDGNFAVVGAYLDDGGLGSAYVFDANIGAQLTKLVPNDALGRIQFGISIAIDDGLVLVGARGLNPSGINTGVAYLFDATSGVQLAQFLAPDGSASDNFGYSLDVDEGIAIISAHEDNVNGLQSGSAYLFDVSTKTLLTKISAHDASAGDLFGWAVGIDGSSKNGRAIVGARFGDNSRAGTGSAYLFDVQRVPEPSSPFLCMAVASLALIARLKWHYLSPMP